MTAREFSELVEDNFNELFDFVEDYKGKNGKTTEEFLKENNLIFVENNDDVNYNSYGDEDSTLERIYLHKPSGNYFMVYGTRQSYNGTEWDGIKGVNKTEKTITVWT